MGAAAYSASPRRFVKGVTKPNELSELCRCVRVLVLDACDRERCARGRHVGVGLRCAEPEL